MNIQTKNTTSRSYAAIFCAMVCFLWPRAAHADLGYWSSALIGTWRHPTTGDVYRFKSNATYTFTAGPVKRRSGNISHSGTWRIYDPGEAVVPGNEGPVGLQLRSNSRVVLEGSRRRTLRANRVFKMLVDIPHGNEEKYIGKYYYIASVRWVRIR